MAGLRTRGLRPGDPVIFQFEYNDDFIAAFWACACGEFVPAPIAVPALADSAAAANEERLYAALGYMAPAIWHRGQPNKVRDERARRIAAARAHRRMTNQQRFTEAA